MAEMNQKIVLSMIFMSIVLMAGCAQNNTTYKEIDIGCLPGLRDGSDPLVIRNQDEYDALLVEYYAKTKEKYKTLWSITNDDILNKALPFKNCDAKLTTINFKKYTLLSRFDGGSGCSTEFKKNVQIDHNNKKVVFTIEVIENGSCEPWRTQRTSILIPKIPDDYTVDFFNSPTSTKKNAP